MIGAMYIDQLGRVVELRAHLDASQGGWGGGVWGCKGCLYAAFQHCRQGGERPLKADGKHAPCFLIGIFVEVTHE